jgi:hypothetical protein
MRASWVVKRQFADVDSGFAVGYTGTNLSWSAAQGPDPRWLPWLTALA